MEDLKSLITWLFLDHFSEYNRWPWAYLNSFERQVVDHSSFVFIEFFAFGLVILSCHHAWTTADPDDSRRLKLIWSASFIVGFANDYIFMLLPIVDNFWQAQAVVMISPRMPLYIPCMYNALLYWPAVGAARVFYHGNKCHVAEASLGGLLCVIFYAPYDLCGARFLWWTWHESDPGVRLRWLGVPAGSTSWTITFAFSFCYLLRVGANHHFSQLKTLAFACLSTPMMIVMLNLLGLFGIVDKVGMPGPRTIAVALLLFSGAVLYRVLNPHSSQVIQLLQPEPWPVRVTLFSYFAMLAFVMACFSPENQVSTGAHQLFGDCKATDIDMMGYVRSRYICRERYPSFYFSFNCAPAPLLPSLHLREVVPRWERVTPEVMMLRNNQTVASWYTICGQPHESWPTWMSATLLLGFLGSGFFHWAFTTVKHEKVA